MFFLTGDTHIPLDVTKLNTKRFPDQKRMTSDDFLIVLGDFGLLWKKDAEYEWWKKWFNRKPFTTLWIDGNHENHDWIDSLPVESWNGGKIHRISKKIIHLMRGQIFKINGKTFFTMGGASSIDKGYRTEGESWWKREEPSHQEYEEALRNLASFGNKVDVILTHTCPKDLIFPMFKLFPEQNSGVERFFNQISLDVSFSDWYFGHWHEDKDFGKFHCLYNKVIEI